MEPVLKLPVTAKLSTSDCDSEDGVINANESKPPSPLSLQQDGGVLSVQSPPFENETVGKPPSTLSDCSNQAEFVDANDSQSTVNSDIDETQPGLSATREANDIEIIVHQKPTVSMQRAKVTALKSDDSDNINLLAEQDPTNLTADVKQSISVSSANIGSLSRTVPVKKSVQQLYGQPSWWGDADNDYSYPHTSLLGTQDPAEAVNDKGVSEHSGDDEVETDIKPQPRSEAFVINFEPDESRGPIKRSLSHFVPDRLRRGFDERERLKREKEKESELRRQTFSPMAQNTQRSTRAVALRAANAKQIASGRPATASTTGAVSRGGRPKPSTTRPSTATATTSGRRSDLTTSRPTVARLNSSNSPAGSTPRRTVGSVPSTPLARTSKTAGSASVTPRQSNASATRDVVNHAINRVSALQKTTNRVGVTQGRKPSTTTGGTGTTLLTRQLSLGTDRSAASRRTAPPGPVKPGPLMAKTGLTVSPRATTTGHTASPVTKTMDTSKARGGLQSHQPATRGFMSATTSSGAKRVTPVQPTRTNRPLTATTTTTTQQQNQKRTSFGPAPGNSVKRPVTSTQLRRPVNSTRTPIRRSYTDLADKRSAMQPPNSLPHIQYEASASVMATIDAYDDPKAYLFYRMFLGSEQDEPTTDSVFRTFTSETLSDHTANHPVPIDAILRPDGITAVSSPDDCFANGGDKTWCAVPHTESTPTSNTIAPNMLLKPDLSETLSTDPVHRSSVTPESTPLASQPTNIQLPLTPERKQSVPAEVPQPAASKRSPQFQHRSFTTPDTSPTKHDTLHTSMLVGTSVTSLAATYILEPGNTLVDRGLITPQSTDADQLATPRGSLTCLTETEEDLEHKGSPSRRSDNRFINDCHSPTKAPPTGKNTRTSPHPISCTGASRPSTIQFKRHLNNPPNLTASVDLPTATSITNLEQQMNTSIALSSGALFEACRDDFDVNRTQTSTLSTDALNTSDHVNASATSLATYVLDMDDTLAAQGLVPAVVVESREDLLLSPTMDLRSALGSHSVAHRTRSSAESNAPDRTNDTAFTQTPKAVTPHGDFLWDVLETDECIDDANAGNFAEDDDTQNLLTELENQFNVQVIDATEDEEDIECYQSLPQPYAFHDRITSRQELESRPHRTYVASDSVKPHENGSSSPGAVENRRESTTTCPTTDRVADRGNFVTSGKTILPPSETKRSPSLGFSTPGQYGGSTVVLKRPEYSPSSSSSSPLRTTDNEGVMAVSATSPFSPTGAVRHPRPGASPELTRSGPRSTYAPLADIHDCYRALQQSVNYLIQSQTGLLNNATSENVESGKEPVTSFTVVGTGITSEYENLPLRGAQSNYSTASQSAAMWPSDLTLPSGATRRSLSRKHRMDRTRQSTASLDSALQRWDDSGTISTENAVRQLRQQQQSSSFYDPRSGSTAPNGSQKTFTFKSGDEVASRLSSVVDGNITTSGDSGLQSYSASLSQSDRKSHPSMINEQLTNLGHGHRAMQSSRTGSASVPEPASPTGSGSSHSATKGWYIGQHHPTTTLEPSIHAPVRAMNPLNRTYDFSGQNGPQILSRIARGCQLAPTTERDQPMPPSPGSTTEPFINGSSKPSVAANQIPAFDSSTFTRRKGSISQDSTGASEFNANSYQAWVAGISALSQGIESLTKTPLFRSARESNANPNTKRSSTDRQMGSASDLPDSTTDSPLPGERVRSAFVTPIPQRSLGISHVDPGRPANLVTGQPGIDLISDDPTETTTYYTLMVDSIRHLSLKLRQCSDKLVQRVNAEQSAALGSSPTGRRTSRASSTDSVPPSTKFALNDALENMRMINEQLKMVDELLFSRGWNGAQQQQQQQSLGRITEGGASNQARLGQTNLNHFTFVPIEPEDRKPRMYVGSITARAGLTSSLGVNRHPSTNSSAYLPRKPSQRVLMDEEQEYY